MEKRADRINSSELEELRSRLKLYERLEREMRGRAWNHTHRIGNPCPICKLLKKLRPQQLYPQECFNRTGARRLRHSMPTDRGFTLNKGRTG